jgi:predicted DNA-binding ArsR family transcriptional regulator
MQTVETILGNKPSIRKAILLEYAKTPDGISVKHIDEKLGVSGLDKNHLKKLEEFGILETHPIKVCRPAGRFKTMTACTDKGYRLKQDPETLHIMVTKAFDHDRDSQIVFMRSPYYHSMIPVLRDRVCKLMHLSEVEAYTLKSALSTNWLALKFVDHFISEEDERTDILRYLARKEIDVL